MKQVQAYRGQSVLDVALMACGSADYAHEVAAANGLAVEAVLDADQVLRVPTASPRVAGEMERAGVVPCSGEQWMRDGIGYMAVGIDFIID